MSASASSAAPHRSVVSIRGGQPQAPTTPHTPPRAIPSSFGSPSSIRAEEDVIVVEVGSRLVRVGFAGDNAPRVQLQLPPEEQRRVGDYRRWASGYEDDWGKRAMGAAWGTDYELWSYDLRSVDLGLVEDKLDRLLREAFSKCVLYSPRRVLKTRQELTRIPRHLLIDSKPRRIALVVPSSLPLPLLSTTLDMFFNRFQSPMVSLLSSATMSTVSAGLRSALVVDLGWAETVVTSVYEYREVRSTRSVRGGRHLVSSLHKIIKEAVQEKGVTPREGGEDEDNRHVISFGECEEICKRAVWCKPAQKPAAPGQDEGLATVEEQDESEAEAPTTTPENRTMKIPLRTAQPPTNLDMRFTQLAEACENTYFEQRDGAPATFDDEELPIHWLVYQHLLRLPLDVRAACMSRIVFTGGSSRVIGLKGRIFDEVAELVRKRGWDAVTGRGVKAAKSNLERHRRSLQASMGPTRAQGAEDAGVWHDAANEAPESNAIDEQLERRKAAPPVQGQLRAVDSLGPWCGASLACQLKVLAMANVERENWAQHGISGASRPGEVDIKAQQRQSLGPGGLMRGGGGQDRAWTLGAWGI